MDGNISEVREHNEVLLLYYDCNYTTYMYNGMERLAKLIAEQQRKWIKFRSIFIFLLFIFFFKT